MKTKSDIKRLSNGKGAAVLEAVSVETRAAIENLISEQSFMACDWQNWISYQCERAEKAAREAKTPKNRRAWQKRLAAAERSRILVGAALSHAMRTVGKSVADVIEIEFCDDPHAVGLADDLRKFNPCPLEQ